MKLFHWQSEALADYNEGDIVVAAKTVEAARRKVIKAAKKWFPATINNKAEMIAHDILREPTIEDVVFITGSA